MERKILLKIEKEWKKCEEKNEKEWTVECAL